MEKWTLFRVISGQEGHIASGKSLILNGQFSEFYAPQYEKRTAHRRYRGVYKRTTVWAFPTYVFAKMRRRFVDWQKVRKESRFVCPIYDGEGSPVVLDSGLIEAVRDLERQEFLLPSPEFEDGLRVGQEYVVEFRGLPVRVRIEELRKTQAVCVPVSLLLASVKTSVSRDLLSELPDQSVGLISA